MTPSAAGGPNETQEPSMTPIYKLTAAALLSGLAASGAQALEYKDGALPSNAIAALDRAEIQDWFDAAPTGQRLVPQSVNTREIWTNGTVPAGVAVRELPEELLGQLREIPGHRYGRIGAHVVLIETETGIVRDVLRDVAG